ncbi:sensor histidine kinase [Streptomyces sp. TR06-5]|uniref:sensor histidine kinase n=1 Tax=unclassified Streptomyces TaxID=2593676 RepID=UPI0039A1FE5A
MHRIYDFVRRHPLWVDGLWAVLLLALSTLWLAAPQQRAALADSPVWRVAAAPVLLAPALVVALRRRAPEKMLLLAGATGVVQLATGMGPHPGNFALLVIIFTVASRSVRWASRLALAGGLLTPALATLRWPPAASGLWQALLGWLFLTVPFALAWVLGDSLRTRRAYYAELEARAARLEREREAQAKVAVAAERARIARELHDVVAHNVSVMVVQADGASYVLDSAPDQARQALHTVSATGRQALAEMRRLLGVLRSGDGEQQPGEDAYLPQPGVAQLEDLVEQVRGTGVTVAFAVEGTPRPLPGSVELAAYRIVQEALTNTRKHGGPDAGARIRLTFGEEHLTLLAEDDGRGARPAFPEDGGADGLGQGLIGMRERVGVVGGSLEIGPRPGGGFRVRALLPLRSAA